MSEPENFLERWSKRKLAKGDPAEPQQAEAPPQPDKEAPASKDSEAAAAESRPFDPSSLPSIESIGANSDVAAFLRPGVPPELTRAALRRAWSSDPAIRDFVGLVENGWDFNDPHAMAGFGPISAGEVARLAGQLIGELPAVTVGTPGETPKDAARGDSHDQPVTVSQVIQPVAEPGRAVAKSADVHRNIKNDAAQKDADSEGRSPTERPGKQAINNP